MNLKFNKRYWGKKLQYSDWYIRLKKDLDELFLPVVHDNRAIKTFRHKVYGLVEEMLDKNQIPLAEKGFNFDKERKQIDTIVIHHTEEYPNLSPFKISAIGFIRLYASKYLQNDVVGYKLKGKPVWSGHFYNGKQVFFGYHWCIYPNGKIEQWLDNSKIGWHSGVWDVNTRSIGIALAGNYEHSTPSTTQIQSVATIIKEKYSYIDKSRIFGHLEVRRERTCPGDKFINGWKETLINLL